MMRSFGIIQNNNQGEKIRMLNTSVIRGLVNDLLSDNEYSLEGLAVYTGYPEDAIFDLIAGINTNPTIGLSTKIIELHAIARRDFYDGLVKKILANLPACIANAHLPSN